MKITEAINAAVEHFRSVKNYRPTHCDVRCVINDLVEYNSDYNQDRAFSIVRNRLGTPIRNR